jgi:hypothetical protein
MAKTPDTKPHVDIPDSPVVGTMPIEKLFAVAVVRLQQMLDNPAEGSEILMALAHAKIAHDALVARANALDPSTEDPAAA